MPLGVIFSNPVLKLKAHSSKVSFYWNAAKETFELWAWSFRKCHPKWDWLYYHDIIFTILLLQTYIQIYYYYDINHAKIMRVCVIKLTVLPPAPRQRLQRLPRRWERTPRCRCSIQPAAWVRVSCGCARFVGMFVYACRFCQATNRVINTQITLRVRSWSLVFMCIGLFL